MSTVPIPDEVIDSIRQALTQFVYDKNLSHDSLHRLVNNDNTTGLTSIEKAIKSKTLERWLILGREYTRSKFNEAEKGTLIKYVIAIIRSQGKEPVLIDGIPEIEAGSFVFNDERYVFYYWNGYNHLAHGEIHLLDKKSKIVKKEDETQHSIYIGNAIGSIEGDTRIELKGDFVEDSQLVNIRFKRKNNEGILSHITFRKRTSHREISLGTFCTSTTGADNKFPKAGLVALIQRKAYNNVDRSLLEYILYQNVIVSNVPGFNIKEISLNNLHIPHSVRMWAQIRGYAGYYETFFIHSKDMRLNVGIIKIEENGHAKVIFEKDLDRPYEGIIRSGMKAANQLILSADYDAAYMDYRVKIYLEAGNKKDVMKGIYTCFLSNGDSPHASKFFMRKIDIDVNEINDRVKTIPIETKTELARVLKSYNVLSYFEDSKEGILSPFAFFASK